MLKLQYKTVTKIFCIQTSCNSEMSLSFSQLVNPICCHCAYSMCEHCVQGVWCVCVVWCVWCGVVCVCGVCVVCVCVCGVCVCGVCVVWCVCVCVWCGVCVVCVCVCVVL